MGKRKIINIDKEKCNGCGNCVTGCQEGALQIIDGKAELVNEMFCDGFGDCIGECPTGALTIEEREAEEFDLKAAAEHVEDLRGEKAAKKMVADQQKHHGGCPGTRMEVMDKAEPKETDSSEAAVESRLEQWPVQINLLPPTAPYFAEANLLITADCVPVAYGDYHRDLLAEKAVAMGCPKLDDGGHYVDKLAAIIENNNLQSITIARMEVPCCGGLVKIVEEAIAKADTNLEPEIVTIGIDGTKK